MRLIDADLLLDRVDDKQQVETENDLYYFLELIDSQPTINIQEEEQ